ncbi:hypothetical protein FB446DRAFT_602541, partial [Lentinula raphanica]
WQLNNKLQLSDIPSWDGNGKTLIEYLIRMYELASRSELLARGLGIWAPDSLKDTARSWWLTIPQADRNFLTTSWWHIDECLRAHFIDKAWIADRTLEFEMIRFRSEEHRGESPVAFIQRRNHYASFLYPYSHIEEEPMFIARLLSTAPPSWEPHINERVCPTVVQLQARAKQLALTLVMVWKTEERFKELSRSNSLLSQRRRPFSRKAHISEIGEESVVEEELDEEAAVVDLSVAAADRSPSVRGDSSKLSSPASQPSGKFMFARDDSIRSRVPPAKGKACYVCNSPLHFARDCKNYGQWMALKTLNRVHANISEAEIADDDRLY